jgi:hypothetical protein
VQEKSHRRKYENHTIKIASKNCAVKTASKNHAVKTSLKIIVSLSLGFICNHTSNFPLIIELNRRFGFFLEMKPYEFCLS